MEDLNKIIDWELATNLAGNQRCLAEELLQILLSTLANDIIELKKLVAQHDIKNLEKQVHKLHGALCYCGLPRLKQAVILLECALKQNKLETIPALFSQIEMESQLVLKYPLN